VLDGQTGILVNPESSEDVAQAILAILGDPALAARMGAAGRKWALDEFSEEALARSLKELLRPFGIENERLSNLVQARRQP
jgi:phosphatidyl-myo-inositol dimannoside synthase